MTDNKPSWQHVTVKKLSLCPCGQLALKDGIPLGTEYEILTGTEESGFIICGNCGRAIPVHTIFVRARGKSKGGLLPKEIFEPLEF